MGETRSPGADAERGTRGGGPAGAGTPTRRGPHPPLQGRPLGCRGRPVPGVQPVPAPRPGRFQERCQRGPGGIHGSGTCTQVPGCRFFVAFLSVHISGHFISFQGSCEIIISSHLALNIQANKRPEGPSVSAGASRLPRGPGPTAKRSSGPDVQTGQRQERTAVRAAGPAGGRVLGSRLAGQVAHSPACCLGRDAWAAGPS